MWIKWNDHAPKNECASVYNICPKREILKKNQIWPFFCLLFSSPKKIIKEFIITIFLCHGPLPFSIIASLLPLPTKKPVGPCQWIMKALKYVFWGPQTSWSLWYLFPRVNQSDPKTSSTTNHKFYRALE